MPTKLTYWVTVGHGYLEVPRELVEAIGFVPTPYSYGDGEVLFLEEDCDMTAFLWIAEGVEIVTEHAPWRYPPAAQCDWAVEGTSTYEAVREEWLKTA